MAISFQQWLAANGGNYGSLTANPLTNAAYESNLDAILGRIGGYAGTYNTKRQTAATNAATYSKNQGLSDETSVEQAASVTPENDIYGQGASITYKIKMSPDGRLYRQAYLNNVANTSARGWGGSDDVSQQWSARQALNAQRDQITTDLSGKQDDLTTEQMGKVNEDIGNFGTGIRDYGTWKQDNIPNSPTSASGGGGSDAPPADQPAAAAKSKIVGRYAARPNIGNRTDVKIVKRGANAPKNQRYLVVRK